MPKKYNLRKREPSPNAPNKKQKTESSEESQTTDYIEDSVSSLTLDDYYAEKINVGKTEETDEEEEDDHFEEFIDGIANGLKKYNVPREKIKELFQSNIVRLYENVMADDEEYIPAEVSISKEDMKTHGHKLEKIKEIIESQEPTLKKILEANLTSDEKVECFQIFEIYINTSRGTEEHFYYRSKLIGLLKKNSGKNEQEVDKLEQEEKRLIEKIKDTRTLKARILNLECSDDVKTKIFSDYLKLENHSYRDSEYSTIKNQIEWQLKLPYDKKITPEYKNKKEFFENVQKTLNIELYGLDQVKQKLLFLLNNTLTTDNKSRKCVALCGPPGTGKTAIASAFAKSVGLPFEAISLGGQKDSTVLYGSDRVWSGSGPGLIVKILTKMKCSNGIILFDELDKLGETPHGREMQYAILHIADYIQNDSFRDKYLADVKIDISNMWFFYSMNSTKNIDRALINRLPIINVENYKLDEKKLIVRDYVVPKELKNVGMKPGAISFNDDAITYMLENYCNDAYDSGIRTAQNIVQDIVSKINFFNSVGDVSGFSSIKSKVKNFSLPFIVDGKNIEEFITGETKKEFLTYFS